jgi:hypothetical protein
MATITCKDFQNQFESPEDGPRPGAPAGFNGHPHLRDCPACRSFVEDLGMIRAAATQLAASDPEPPERIWNALRSQLDQEGIIREAAPSRSWVRDLFSGRIHSLPRPVLAGGYLSVLLAVAFGLSGPINSRINRQRWLKGTQSSTTPVSAHLMSAEQASFSSLPASETPVTASLHKNLEIVDNYISLCENSVREEPENELAREYLYDAYHQKADLLARLNEQ